MAIKLPITMTSSSVISRSSSSSNTCPGIERAIVNLPFRTEFLALWKIMLLFAGCRVPPQVKLPWFQ